MTSLLAIPLLLLGELSIRISPDREFAISYSDEPLLVEISGVRTGNFEVSGNTTDSHERITEFSLRRRSFTEGSSHFIAVPHDSSTLGQHKVTLIVDGVESRETYFRLRHPDTIASSPFRMTLDAWNDKALDVALDIPISGLRIGAADVAGPAVLRRLKDSNIDVHLVAHRAGDLATTESLEGWVADFGEWVDWWEFEITNSVENASPLIRALRRLLPDARVALRVQLLEELEVFLNSENRPFVSRVVVTAASTEVNPLQSFRLAAALAGMETVAFSLNDGLGAPERKWTQLVEDFSPLSRITIDIPAIDIKSEGGLERLAISNAWAEVFSEYVPVGPYYIHSDVSTYLFRHREPDHPWLMAMTSTVIDSVELPPEFGEPFIFAGMGATSDRIIEAVELDALPAFISGAGAMPISRALCNALALDAGLLTAVDSYSSALTGSMRDALSMLTACEPGDPLRNSFFVLVRQLPVLEQRYLEGQLPVHVAIPVIARLTRIARIICALEQESDHAFLEQAESTLDRCNEFLAEYLSQGSGGSRSDRDEQLFLEINRLMEEAIDVKENGRSIEAAGIAIIAEWRARALLTRSD